MTLRTILHPTDFSEGAAGALEVAARFATVSRATLVILHAELLHDHSPRGAALDEYVATARRLLGSLSGNNSPPLDVVRKRAVLAHEAILGVAADRDVDLIVMGTHGRRGLSRLLLGSNTERVLRESRCHVVTVRANAAIPSDGTFRKLLVPVDYSDSARLGLDGALALAANRSAEIHLVHVIEPLPAMYFAGSVTTRFELDGDLRVRVQERLRIWAGEPSGVQYVVEEGHPAVEIARVADDRKVDLIVMSSAGMTAAEWLLVGSVTERVCRLANVPVLTMPKGDRAE